MAKIRNSSLNNVYGSGKQQIFTDDNGKEYVIKNSSVDNFYGSGKQKIIKEKGSSGGLAEMIVDALPWWGCLLLVIIIMVVNFVFPGEFWGFVGKVLFFIPNLFS